MANIRLLFEGDSWLHYGEDPITGTSDIFQQFVRLSGIENKYNIYAHQHIPNSSSSGQVALPKAGDTLLNMIGENNKMWSIENGWNYWKAEALILSEGGDGVSEAFVQTIGRGGGGGVRGVRG